MFWRIPAGRPLGLHWDANGNLLIADTEKGLLRVSPEGGVETLTASCGGRPLVFTDDLETTSDGRIWFTDASIRFKRAHWKMDIIENRGNGRLCVYDPKDGSTLQYRDAMYFANGVAIDPDEQFVLVNETSRYRVRRIWIAGPQQGESDIFIGNLPGFPDGISTGTDGVFWIAMASPRNAILDATSSWPRVRAMILRLPEFVVPKPESTARVIGVNRDGQVVADLFDPTGHPISMVTSVQERNGKLYLGSLTDTAWGWIPRPTTRKETH
ncbi:MAG: SMP-30/gluconolactonase/LRE family protein [Deltaproteobacteria bacterium]|nr:SMP-30/gluconolactonase/LRE family protein [Deltaproteobacteria bacterium]